MSLPSRSSAPATSASSTRPAWPTSATPSSRVDVDPAKVDALNAGKAPLFEPGLDELLARALPTGRLRFTTDYAEVAARAACTSSASGTPQRAGENAADTSYVDAAVGASLAPHLTSERAGRGQVHGAGRHRRPAARAAAAGAPAGTEVRLAWNPEFLREGFAIEDTLAPDRLVYGVAGPTAEADAALLDEVYAAPLATGTPAPGHRLRHRRAGQGRRQRVPGHQDLVHQRHGRGLRGRRRRRRPSSPTRSATTTGSGASSSTPASASAAAACPRTSARSWPAPASSAPTRP